MGAEPIQNIEIQKQSTTKMSAQPKSEEIDATKIKGDIDKRMIENLDADTVEDISALECLSEDSMENAFELQL